MPSNISPPINVSILRLDMDAMKQWLIVLMRIINFFAINNGESQWFPPYLKTNKSIILIKKVR